jgi:lichenan operon transcriptional antiterminator
MQYLQNRYQLLFKTFIESDVPLTRNLLASMIGVSQKTIQSDIKKINSILEANGAMILSKSGVGFYIEIQNEELFNQFKKEMEESTLESKILSPVDAKGRINYIIRKLLLIDYYIKLDDLAEELYSSRSTISADLREVREILNTYKLSIEVKPNYGLMIVGSEIQKRLCIMDLIFSEPENTGYFVEDYSIFKSKQNLAEIALIKDIVRSIANQYEIRLSDVSFQDLVIYILVSLRRIRFQNYVVLPSKDLDRVKNRVEYQVALQIIEELDKIAGDILPESETGYLAILLMTKRIANPEVIADQTTEDLIIVNNIINGILVKIRSYYGLDLSGDNDLRKSLEYHLPPLLTRMRLGIKIRNPMLLTTKKNMVLPIDLAVIIALVIKDQECLEIDEDEIGYLALLCGVAMERDFINARKQRILLISSNGVSEARLLDQRLQQQANDLVRKIDICERYQLPGKDLDQYDYLISTTPLKGLFKIPVFEAENFLQMDDIEKFRMLVVENLNIREQIISLFSPDHFVVDYNPEKKEDALKLITTISGDMVQNQESYYNRLCQRESIMTFECGNGFAVASPLKPELRKSFSSVVVFKKPIIWMSQFVQVLFLMNICPTEFRHFYPINEFYSKILSDYKISQNIIKCRKFNDFKEEMEKFVPEKED